MRVPAEVSVLAEAGLVDALRWVFEGQVKQGEAQADGRVPVTVRGYRVEMVAAQLAGFGRGIEVLAPPEARAYLSDVGRQLTAMYGQSPAP